MFSFCTRSFGIFDTKSEGVPKILLPLGLQPTLDKKYVMLHPDNVNTRYLIHRK